MGATSESGPAAGQPGEGVPHSLFEDVQGLLIGTLFVALAVLLFREAGLFTGGTTGLAFLLHYQHGWSLSGALFLLNLPFYLFGWWAIGPRFTAKTFAAVALLALYVEWLPRWIGFDHLSVPFAALLAGLMAGAGILMLIRHQASLGGIGIMALWMQQRLGWRAGHVQMVADIVILLLGLAVIPPLLLVWSTLGAVAMNAVIAINHRKGRYFGV
jgi:uncharacterized membrane-anchored protein YitT (DUF2179 family)